ncbi:histidine--tRNA ligase [Candidatus Tachikawaea gelatinosa]|uniref:Histidine--tRNA ligase n=1 Tax=Candidatus Tachikawaea gelatinosa TaxID=1410383 RepID=A0A090BWE1_9ENTR|nr:histidine--tRNA ligase [Candidatus Tachikawaea gelatinosa]BAP58446.1 histidine--tRNA ligase [Candidatus Tachikawaea gelatinosa]
MKNNKISAVRGMNDYLPQDTIILQTIENVLKKILNNYGYSEIRMPILEKTILFEKAIGTFTDLINKEMYTFSDKKGKSITLRPEGTAGCVRSIIKNYHILNNYYNRLWYLGPMFRYERPQNGRYRQFHQLGVEVFGLEAPMIDAELIMMSSRFWKQLKILNYVTLHLNSIGSIEIRLKYRNVLIKYLKSYEHKLDKKYKETIQKNPLRILDSKNPLVQEIVSNGPILLNYLDKKSHKNFDELCNFLNTNNIFYKIDPYLVRGLDYYNDTVFEWKTEKLGSQNAICSGGRYDNLIQHIDQKKSISAIGFAIGIERLFLLIKNINNAFKYKKNISIYIVSLKKESNYFAIQLAEEIRNMKSMFKIFTDLSGKNLKKQLIYANKFKINYIIIIDDKNIKKSKILFKDLNLNSQFFLSKNDLLKKIFLL